MTEETKQGTSLGLHTAGGQLPANAASSDTVQLPPLSPYLEPGLTELLKGFARLIEENTSQSGVIPPMVYLQKVIDVLKTIKDLHDEMYKTRW